MSRAPSSWPTAAIVLCDAARKDEALVSAVTPRHTYHLEWNELMNFLRNLFRSSNAMDRDAAIGVIKSLIDAGFVADDQRADAAIEKVALEAGLSREQFKAALKYAREQKWIADSNKAAWSVVTQAGVDAANAG
jgi:hypothetical protein